MVNPLHDKLPRLVFSVKCTCNCFDAAWVRNHWNVVRSLWKNECVDIVGPIGGHVSDGDSRRRQLMLQDYKGTVGSQLKIDWEGWILSASLDSMGNALGLHDQDYIHNRKKLIYPLDSPVRTFYLGQDICCLEHIGLVNNKYTYDQHGLKLDDVQRTNR